MLVELNKQDLIRLIRSCTPDMNQATDYMIQAHGKGGTWGDSKWMWNKDAYLSDAYSVEYLWKVYELLR